MVHACLVLSRVEVRQHGMVMFRDALQTVGRLLKSRKYSARPVRGNVLSVRGYTPGLSGVGASRPAQGACRSRGGRCSDRLPVDVMRIGPGVADDLYAGFTPCPLSASAYRMLSKVISGSCLFYWMVAEL